MPIRNAACRRWLWRPALAALAALAFWLVACSASQGASPAPVSTAITAPATMVTVADSPTAPVASPTSIATLAPAATTVAVVAANTAAPASPTAGATAAATPVGTATPDPAVAAILAYLDARARADVTALTGLSCKTWKPKAVTEAVSFRSMNAKLVGVTCQVNGSAGSYTLVGCGGKMVTTYGTESRDWDLSAFVYQVIAEDGQWKMCGYH